MILALDLATSTGWAALINGRVESGVVRFDLKRGESAGMRFVRFGAWLVEILAHAKPKLILFEQAHHRGAAATEICVGLMTRVMEAAAARDIHYQAVRSMDLKKFMTGKGTAKKEEMIAAVKDHYAYMRDRTDLGDDEADALALLRYGRTHFEAGL